MGRRIGVTMRSAKAPGYDETRDALARDWAAFLAWALPESKWVPVPSQGPATVAWAKGWELDAFVLTGGNDVGEDPVRDESERALLSHAVDAKLPVLGVCRGLQLIQHHFGGALAACDRATHVATTQVVRFADGGSRRVNSFHGFGIAPNTLASPLVELATSEDGWIEAARHRESPILGVMWHPERVSPGDEADRELVRRLFA